MPKAKRIFGSRGTPFGAPVVPEVRRTIRPAAATMGRESPSRIAASITVMPPLASCPRAANSWSQITIPIWWVLNAAANASVRKSVLSSHVGAHRGRRESRLHQRPPIAAPDSHCAPRSRAAAM